ncbi:MAG: NADH-quinone oxidoreductase subunit N [Chthonomonas sp.]|nr:NADH-quinone oxidoreductase subunit N [Chthonomonas sp.]
MQNILQLYNVTPPSIDWLMLMPVLFMIGTGLLSLIVMSAQKSRDTMPLWFITIVGSICSGYSAIAQLNLPVGTSFSNMVMRDKMAVILQLAIAVITLVVALFSDAYLKQKRIAFREFYPLVAWAAAGAMIMVSTTNLLMLFIGLEVLSIALYVMVAMSRYELKSEESAIKYFLLGAFASAFLLYGIAFIYGATGSVQIEKINLAWGIAPNGLVAVGVGLMLVGVLFKAALVPFHQWTPDVYQGAPTNVTAFMAAASKVAAIGALYRILDASDALKHLYMPALYWIAILTMVIPNLLALVQTDVKRVLGYSSIANAGYVLVGLLAAIQMKQGPGTAIIYLVGYSLMTVGAFAVISLAANGGKESTTFDDLRGLWRRSPIAAGLLTVFVVSLIGIPPTAGFWGKLLIFQDAVRADMVSLAIVLAVSSLISLYYYLRILLAAVVSEEESENPLSVPKSGHAAALVTCAVGVIGLMFAIGPLSTLING